MLFNVWKIRHNPKRGEIQALEYLERQIEAQRGRLFLWLPVALGLGIVGYFSLSFEPSLYPAVISALVFLGLAILFRDRGVGRRFFVLLLFFALGFLAAGLRTQIVYTPILSHEMKTVGVTGVVRSVEPLSEGGGVRTVLQDVSLEKIAPEYTPRFVRLKLRNGDEVLPGQRLSVLAGLNPPSPPVMPGGFDFQRYAFFQGLGAIGFAYGRAEIVGVVEEKEDHFIEVLRTSIARRVSDAMPGADAAIANALMTGPRAAISDEDKDAIRDAGLAHMLSISGLHIGLVFGAIFFFIRAGLALFPVLALKWPIKKMAACAAMAGAIFYALISGGSVPTIRAVLMMGVVFLAILLDRKAISMRLIAFAALVVLLVAPDSLLGVSFQLSFAAVGALIAFYEAATPYLIKWRSGAGLMRRLALYVFGVCITSAVASLATAPFSLFHFQQIALYSLLGNLLAVPVLGFVVMPFAVLSFVMMPLGLETWPLWVVGQGIELILRISHWVAGMDGAVWRVHLWPQSVLWFFSAGFVWMLLVRGSFKWLALIPMVVAVLMAWRAPVPDILVSDNGKLVALQVDGGGLAFSDFRAERFARENYVRAFGQDKKSGVRWPRSGELDDLRCDQRACRLDRSGHKVSFLRGRLAEREECAWADLVIAEFSVKKCKARVIDYWALRRGGAQAVYLGQNIAVRTVSQERGERPWNAAFQHKKD